MSNLEDNRDESEIHKGFFSSVIKQELNENYEAINVHIQSPLKSPSPVEIFEDKIKTSEKLIIKNEHKA